MKVQSRPNGAWEIGKKRWGFRRLTLRRSDGIVYLDRWEVPGVIVQVDAGVRAFTRDASHFARLAEAWPGRSQRGVIVERPRGSVNDATVRRRLTAERMA